MYFFRSIFSELLKRSEHNIIKYVSIRIPYRKYQRYI